MIQTGETRPTLNIDFVRTQPKPYNPADIRADG
jgi:hypothetical protein